MSSPVPTLRAPVPGGNRSLSGTRTPRLGLAIPPSPSQRPVNSNAGPPQLALATPMGSQSIPREGGLKLNIALVDSSNNHDRSRSNSFHNPSVPGSAASEQSRYAGASDPTSAISSIYSEPDRGIMMERADSMSSISIDFEKLELEKGAPLDVEDLTDDGWTAADEQNKILELGSLGEGAGGAVTRCMLKGGKTIFALKIITTSPDPNVKKQILRELKFNKDCQSDYICRYYGAFMDKASSTISIAMEFCEGGSLDSVYKEVKRLGGRTGEKVLGKVAEGVLHGLTYLNTQKIMHRDIKPSNILLCRNGQVKLCDFGVSGEFGTKGDANTFIGTSYYMAPERIQGQTYNITSDVWSLGVTLLEVAQHRFPFPADGTEMQPRAGLIDLLTYIVAQPTPVLKDEPENNIKWSGNFKNFIVHCLEKEQPRRATPWRMSMHPWIQELQNKNVNMSSFLSQVWDWKD